MLPVILALAWPTMLEQLLQTAVQYIDTAMVGSLGTEAVAAVGSTTTVNWLIGSTVSAIGVGFLAFISQAIGAGENEKARRATGQAALAVLVSGAVFTTVALFLSGVIPELMQVEEHVRPEASKYFFIVYLPMIFRCASIIFGTVLRAAGDTRTPMLVGLAVNGTNVVFNFLLIYPTREIFGVRVFGAGLGVVGAAVATAVSYALGGVLITIAVMKHKSVSPTLKYIKPDREILVPCFRVALPNALQRFGTSLGYVAFAAMVNSVGEVATAAHTIANTVESAFYIPGYGMQTAAATLAGNEFGAKNREKINRLGKMMLLIETVLMILSGGALFLLADPMMGLFSADGEVISLGGTVLKMVALSEPFYGISIIIEGMMMGMGKTTMPFVTNIIGMWGIRIVGTFICTQLLSFGLVSAWGCMILHNLLLFGVFFVYYLSGRWNPLNRAKN
ncbi:MAG: MATE family efflux transporter [Clostridia bacterium]|nr:MATE family efflux transporter [Clostridia bacterium]